MECKIADRLCASIGQDILDCLFSRSTLELLSRQTRFTSRVMRPCLFFVLAILYNGPDLLPMLSLWSLNLQSQLLTPS